MGGRSYTVCLVNSFPARKVKHWAWSPTVREGETLRFRLKVVMPLISDRTIGEAEWQAVYPSRSYQDGEFRPIEQTLC